MKTIVTFLLSATFATAQVVDPPQPAPSLKAVLIGTPDGAIHFFSKRFDRPEAIVTAHVDDLFDSFTNELRDVQFDVLATRIFVTDSVCVPGSPQACWTGLPHDPKFSDVSILLDATAKRPDQIIANLLLPLEEFNQPMGENAWIIEGVLTFDGQQSRQFLRGVIAPEPSGFLLSACGFLALLQVRHRHPGTRRASNRTDKTLRRQTCRC